MIRLFQPPMRFWTIATIAAATAGLAVFVWIWIYASADPTLRNEVLKILLQFLLISVAGGSLLIFLNARRDEDQREAAREAAVREMIEQIHTAYRKLKMVKRRLRSQMAVQSRGRELARNLPYRIPAAAFEKAMEDLLTAQIESEQLRDRLVTRPELQDEKLMPRIYFALNYAARYFHDVYEDFEDCVVGRDKDCYEITAECRGLADFLGRARWKNPEALPWSSEVQKQYEILKNERLSPEERHGALNEIIALRRNDRDIPRYRLVATQCIQLASDDIQRALLRRQSPAGRGGARARKAGEAEHPAAPALPPRFA